MAPSNHTLLRNTELNIWYRVLNGSYNAESYALISLSISLQSPRIDSALYGCNTSTTMSKLQGYFSSIIKFVYFLRTYNATA
jgi:hypothetical protein